MKHTRESLSNCGVCAVYQCLDGHIHLKYRGVDIAMSPDDFYQVAGTIAQAMLVLNDDSDSSKTLADMDIPISV